MKEQGKVQQLYQQMSILTASPEELMIVLLDEALFSINIAKKAIDQKERVVQNQSLQKAQECMLQLITFIETEEEPGKELIAVYDYLNRQLIKANMDSNIKLLEEIAGFLDRQKEDWRIALKNRRKKYSGDLI